MRPSAIISVLPLVTSTWALTYNLRQNLKGADFLEHFDVFDRPDPTHGRVCVRSHFLTQMFGVLIEYFNREYVNRDTAVRMKLLSADGGSFFLRADHAAVLPGDGPGRPSARISTKRTYTTHVTVCVLYCVNTCDSSTKTSC